jgi:hypothetical protein
MTEAVIDASVSIKWGVEEEGTAEALALLSDYRLEAPELLIPERANILWKKVQRREPLPQEAGAAARLLQAADIALYRHDSFCKPPPSSLYRSSTRPTTASISRSQWHTIAPSSRATGDCCTAWHARDHRASAIWRVPWSVNQRPEATRPQGRSARA